MSLALFFDTTHKHLSGICPESLRRTQNICVFDCLSASCLPLHGHLFQANLAEFNQPIGICSCDNASSMAGVDFLGRGRSGQSIFLSANLIQSISSSVHLSFHSFHIFPGLSYLSTYPPVYLPNLSTCLSAELPTICKSIDVLVMTAQPQIKGGKKKRSNLIYII